MTDINERKQWKTHLGWMSVELQDAVELKVLRFLERRAGLPITADQVLAAVTEAIYFTGKRP